MRKKRIKIPRCPVCGVSAAKGDYMNKPCSDCQKYKRKYGNYPGEKYLPKKIPSKNLSVPKILDAFSSEVYRWLWAYDDGATSTDLSQVVDSSPKKIAGSLRKMGRIGCVEKRGVTRRGCKKSSKFKAIWHIKP